MLKYLSFLKALPGYARLPDSTIIAARGLEKKDYVGERLNKHWQRFKGEIEERMNPAE